MPLKKPLLILTFLQTAINAVVGVEVACWFFIGECIGNGGLVLFSSKYRKTECVFIFSEMIHLDDTNIFLIQVGCDV